MQELCDGAKHIERLQGNPIQRKELCKELIAHGLSSTTPAALVEKGTTQEQRVHIGDLTTLHDIVQKNNVKAPTLIIVGEVVKLHDKLNWFIPEGIE